MKNLFKKLLVAGLIFFSAIIYAGDISDFIFGNVSKGLANQFSLPYTLSNTGSTIPIYIQTGRKPIYLSGYTFSSGLKIAVLPIAIRTNASAFTNGTLLPGINLKAGLTNLTGCYIYRHPQPFRVNYVGSYITNTTVSNMTFNYAWGSNTLQAATNAIDRDLATRWESSNTDPSWAAFRIASRRYIDRAIIFWSNSAASNYTLQSSTNTNVAWSTIRTYTNVAHNGNWYQTNSFTTRLADYFRILCTSRIFGKDTSSIWEFYADRISTTYVTNIATRTNATWTATTNSWQFMPSGKGTIFPESYLLRSSSSYFMKIFNMHTTNQNTGTVLTVWPQY